MQRHRRRLARPFGDGELHGAKLADIVAIKSPTDGVRNGFGELLQLLFAPCARRRIAWAGEVG